MRIAIFHNFLDNIGGAEIVDLILARELGADIYTTNIDKEKIKKMGFTTDNIYSIGKVPINAPFKQELSYRKFKKLDLGNEYNFYIIAGDWAMSGAINNKPNLWYIYSPIREIWDLYEDTKNNIVPPWARPFFSIWSQYHRKLNQKNVKEVSSLIAISQNVSGRVKQYLGKDSIVIYPPTETKKFYFQKNGDFWLSVSRLITHKRVDIQMKAFKEIPQEKLIIVGSYEQSRHFQAYARYIKKIKPDNVEILSWVDNKRLIDLYANCKGFITTAKDEDYGMTPVEAMASGKPVIAPNEGGYKETVIEGVTGRLINEINVDKLIAAIKEVGINPAQYKDACLNQAAKFDTEIFVKKIKEQITVEKRKEQVSYAI